MNIKDLLGIAKKHIILVILFSILIIAGIVTTIIFTSTKDNAAELIKDNTVIGSRTNLNITLKYDKSLCDKKYDSKYKYKECKDALKLSGKKVYEGIKINPDIKGQWEWSYDNTLKFIPKDDWLADTDYKISFDKSVFPKFLNVKNRKITLKTEPLRVDIVNFKFLHDPNNISKRVATAKLSFNYPVYLSAIRDSVSLSSDIDGKFQPEIDFKHTNKRIAYVSAEIKELLEKERTLTLKVSKNLCTDYNSCLKKEVRDRVLIPSIYSFFKVKSVDASIVNNAQDKAEQIITLNLSLKAKPDLVDKNISAYLLPEFHPNDLFNKKDKDGNKLLYKWNSPSEITEKIFKDSKEITLNRIASGLTYSTGHNYRVDEPVNRYMLIKLKKGLVSYGDYILEKNYETIIKLPDYKKELKITGSGSILSISGDKKLSLVSRGLKQINCEISRVLPDEINHLVSQTGGNFQKPRFRNYQMNKDNISKLFEEKIVLNYKDAKTTQYSSLNFSKYLTGNQKGLFFLKIQDKDKKVTDERFILITDLGLLVKENSDNTKDVFVMSIATGKPVIYAVIEILGKNGLSVFKGSTDMNGHLNIPSLEGLQRDKYPVAYVVKKANDLSFMPYKQYDRKQNYSKFNISGIRTNNSNLKAYLFTDRGIYRPDETVKFAMVVKPDNWKTDLTGVPVRFIIKDPQGITVKNDLIKLTRQGLQELSFKTEYAAKTGKYTAGLYIVEEDDKLGNLLHSTNFSVEEFLPDRMKISVEFNKEIKEGWVAPNDIEAKVTLTNLYGTPATDRDIKASYTLSPSGFRFDKYKGYKFYNANSSYKTYKEKLGQQITDENGEAVFDVDLSHFNNAMFNMTLKVEGFEAGGGRSVRQIKNLLLSTRPYVVGYKADSSLNYIKRYGDNTVHLIAVNPGLNQIPVSDLKASLIRREYVNTLVKSRWGGYRYESVEKRDPISNEKVNISASGLDYKLNTKEPGQYELVISDNTGNELNKISYSIAGEANRASQINKNAELQLKLNKEKYNKGEIIEAYISSPYAGAGLITIETNKVHSYKWFKTNKTDSVQKIQLPADFEGKGYINVSFIRSLDSKEIYMNPMAYAVAPFYAENKNRKINIELDLKEVTKPDEPLEITYKTDKKSKLIIFGVDEGILQVAKYETPDPLDYFINRNALEVSTYQILDLILPKNSIIEQTAAIGGGIAKADSGAFLNPFRRKVKKPAVFWSGIVDAGPDSKKLRFNLPDYFNGSLKIMAVAVSDYAIGAAAKNTLRKADFIISPNVPTFGAPGDEFEVTATIANNVKDSEIKVDVKTSEHIKIIKKPEAKIKISEGKEKTIKLKLKAEDKLGSAGIKFIVKGGKHSATAESTLSVRPVQAKFTDLYTGYFSGKKDKQILINKQFYPQFAQTSISVAAIPVSLIGGLSKYLENYPYGCTEQTISKMFPIIALYGNPDFEYDEINAREKFNTAIDKLRARQVRNGGFNLWGYGNNSADFTSVYAIHFLTEAKAKGLPVPVDMLDKGIDYLKKACIKSPNSLTDARNTAYGIYILTRNGEIATNYLFNLLDDLESNYKKQWENDLTAVYIASSFKLLQDDDNAYKILNYFDYDYAENQEKYGYYSDLTKYSEYMSLLARHFPEESKTMDEEVLFKVINYISDGKYTTTSSAYAVQAIMNYANAMDRNSGIKTTVMDSIPATVNVAPANETRTFYQVATTGFEKTLPAEHIQNGLTISREYRRVDDGSEVKSSVNLGEEIEVSLTIKSTGGDYVENVAIVDLLPGGFELEFDKVNKGSAQYIDKREDRIIIFTNVQPYNRTIKYYIKAVNPGEYTVPPPYAEAMYDLATKTRGMAGKIKVENSR